MKKDGSDLERLSREWNQELNMDDAFESLLMDALSEEAETRIRTELAEAEQTEVPEAFKAKIAGMIADADSIIAQEEALDLSGARTAADSGSGIVQSEARISENAGAGTVGHAGAGNNGSNLTEAESSGSIDRGEMHDGKVSRTLLRRLGSRRIASAAAAVIVLLAGTFYVRTFMTPKGSAIVMEAAAPVEIAGAAEETILETAAAGAHAISGPSAATGGSVTGTVDVSGASAAAGVTAAGASAAEAPAAAAAPAAGSAAGSAAANSAPAVPTEAQAPAPTQAAMEYDEEEAMGYAAEAGMGYAADNAMDAAPETIREAKIMMKEAPADTGTENRNEAVMEAEAYDKAAGNAETSAATAAPAKASGTAEAGRNGAGSVTITEISGDAWKQLTMETAIGTMQNAPGSITKKQETFEAETSDGKAVEIRMFLFEQVGAAGEPAVPKGVLFSCGGKYYRMDVDEKAGGGTKDYAAYAEQEIKDWILEIS
ncbi:MAG: hypothetical protein IJ061_03835 [Lachnospiraceae bacterium]|nr:hypothetical protein [Lachnospiraceae bacterium]